MNMYKWLNQLNEKNRLRVFLNKNKKILEYVFGKKVDFGQVIDSKIKKDYYILFGFLGIILWFKIHIEKKFSARGNKLTDLLTDI